VTYRASVQLSRTFNVSYDEVSHIPTLVQAGCVYTLSSSIVVINQPPRYAVGILLIAPLGDLVRRRSLMLLLVFSSTLLTIGLSLTTSLAVFEALSFLVGVFSVVPQILIPLTADLVPPERRASALAIVFSGLDSGILYARVIGGTIAEYAPVRVVYFTAIGIQLAVLLVLWALVPDYPAKNPELSYFHILGSMAVFVATEPILFQAALILLLASACFSTFWVTLTFLLGGAPYFFSTYVLLTVFTTFQTHVLRSLGIGLFGLVGLVGIFIGPFTGRLIDRLVPWYATLVGVIGYIVFQVIQVGAGGISIAAVVITCIGIDLFLTMTQISLTTAVFEIELAARARLNAVLIMAIFVGQAIGE
jgi:predicted MFS family arabinose efflux permease